MMRKSRTCIAAAILTLALPAAALQFGGSSLPPQVDVATSRMILQQALDRHPTLFDTTVRSGTFLISIILRPGGEVVRSDLLFVPDQPALARAMSQLIHQLPMGQDVAGLGMNRSRGELVPGNRVLPADLVVQARIVPQDWDAERGEERVRQVVMQQYRELFQPLASGSLTQLTILLNEQGDVIREHQERLIVVGGRQFLSVRPTPVTFAPLGMKWDDVGVIGQIPMTLEPEGGVESRLRNDYSPSMLIVNYAWPRRPGEPAGGENATARGAAPKPGQLRDGTPLPILASDQQFSPAAVAAFAAVQNLAQEHFPPGSPATGNWMLLSQDSQVLRKGHMDLLVGQRMTSEDLLRRVPGVVVSNPLAIGLPDPASGDGAPGVRASVYIFTLAPDSPLPAPER